MGINIRQKDKGESIEKIRKLWVTTASSYSDDDELIQKLWKEIKKTYSSIGRHYHNIDHLLYMLELAEEYKDSIRDFDVLVFAIFYHDIVYKSTRRDNEEKSARIAEKRLNSLGLDAKRIDLCVVHILSTKSHEISPNDDTKYLIDFDLGILSESQSKYLTYLENIRREYAIYPPFMYKKGRKKVLDQFLERDKIYATDFGLRREYRAKANIQFELELLG